MRRRLTPRNEAVARGAYEAGLVFASAYPGTPSTEILENLSKYKEELYCEWAPNEKVAMEAAVGASIAGGRSLCAMKHVGLNVAADPLFTFAYTGVTGEYEQPDLYGENHGFEKPFSNKIKKKKKRRKKRPFLKLFIFLLLIGATIFYISTPKFSIKYVDVKGNHHYSKATIKRMAKVPSENLFFTSMGKSSICRS